MSRRCARTRTRAPPGLTARPSDSRSLPPLPPSLPTRQRLEAQKEAALSLASALLQARVENSVGLLGMSGSGCRLLCSPVSGGVEGDALPKLSACLHGLKPQGGSGDVVCTLRTAQLAFKYAKASEAGAAPQRRAVLFLGSPITASREALERLGKELKKVNVRGAGGCAGGLLGHTTDPTRPTISCLTRPPLPPHPPPHPLLPHPPPLCAGGN